MSLLPPMPLTGSLARQQRYAARAGSLKLRHMASDISAYLFDFRGQPAVHLRAGDGAQAVVLLHGAHLVSWQPAGQNGEPGPEQLFLSERAVYAQGQAVRGGVPVIFPQFEKHGPLPRHGLARTRRWSLVDVSNGPAHAMAVLRLTEDDDTLSHWPHAFATELTVSLGGTRLDIELAAENTGDQPLGFTAALHTYLRVDDLEEVRLEGLAGLHYTDSVNGGEHLDPAPSVAVQGEIDRIYFCATQPLLLREPGRRVAVTAENFNDVVVWNPGPHKGPALADMAPEGYRHMLCVEAARIGQPVMLQPGEEWAGRQTLVAE